MSREDAWTIGIGLAAVVVAFATTPADAAPQTRDVLYAMVKISQPLKIDEHVYENHEIMGSLYADRESCNERARQEMQRNATEVFAGCLAIPAPGKVPAAPALTVPLI